MGINVNPEFRVFVFVLVLVAGITEAVENAGDDVDFEGRGKKKKFSKLMLPMPSMVPVMTMMLGIILVKVIVLPLAFKALAVVSGKAVLLSGLSLILAAILGLKPAPKPDCDHSVKVIHVPLKEKHDTNIDPQWYSDVNGIQYGYNQKSL